MSRFFAAGLYFFPLTFYVNRIYTQKQEWGKVVEKTTMWCPIPKNE